MNQIIMVEKGALVESGSYKELMEEKGQVYNLLNEYGKRLKEDKLSRSHSELMPQKVEEPIVSSPVKKNDASTTQENGKLMSAEDLAQGSVSWSVYDTYAKASSYSSVIIFLLISIFGQGLSVAQNVYLSQWAAFNDRIKDHPDLNANLFIWLSVYGSLGIMYSVAVVIQVIYIWIFCGIRYDIYSLISKVPPECFTTKC